MTPIEKEIARAARLHRVAVAQLDADITKVARTLGTIVGTLERAAEAPPEGGTLKHRGDAAVVALEAAYDQLTRVFDGLVEP